MYKRLDLLLLLSLGGGSESFVYTSIHHDGEDQGWMRKERLNESF